MTAASCQISTSRPELHLVPTTASPLPGPDAHQEGPAQPLASATADSQAIKRLWQAHGATLTRFAMKLTLGDKQRAEDIVQETLVRAWRHPDVVGSGDRDIMPWLFTVSRHIAIEMWRARARAEQIIDDRQTDLAELPDPADDIERALTAIDVRAALTRLTPEHRQVIVEMYYLGQSVADIAQSLGIPEGTVKSRSYYGLRQLRRVLSITASGGRDDGEAASVIPQAAA
jgi:RNA polymerase sigma-70 factor (ECF subfamily)